MNKVVDRLSWIFQLIASPPVVKTAMVRIPQAKRPKLPIIVKTVVTGELAAKPLQRVKCTGKPARRGTPETEKQARIMLIEAIGIRRAIPATASKLNA